MQQSKASSERRMIEELKYPQIDAAASIFVKLGIKPDTRFDKFD